MDMSRGSGWYMGESSRGRYRKQREESYPPSWSDASHDERRAIRMLWQAKGCGSHDGQNGVDERKHLKQKLKSMRAYEVSQINSDAIVISPQDHDLWLAGAARQTGNNTMIVNNLIKNSNTYEGKKREYQVKTLKNLEVDEDGHLTSDAIVITPQEHAFWHNGATELTCNKPMTYSSISANSKNLTSKQGSNGLLTNHDTAQTPGQKVTQGATDQTVHQAANLNQMVDSQSDAHAHELPMMPTIMFSSDSTTTDNVHGSPTRMGQTTQRQGLELQEVLRLFKEANSAPLSSYIMQTPYHKVSDAIGIAQISVEAKGKAMQRKNPRIEEKNSNGKTIIKLAQDLVAKKCGITTLQQYDSATVPGYV
jgi:hypothetical protein